jgi:hypothetical protein
MEARSDRIGRERRRKLFVAAATGAIFALLASPEFGAPTVADER